MEKIILLFQLTFDKQQQTRIESFSQQNDENICFDQVLYDRFRKENISRTTDNQGDYNSSPYNNNNYN